jgi:hypothetical protein
MSSDERKEIVIGRPESGFLRLPHHAYPLMVDPLAREDGSRSVHWFCDDAGFVQMICAVVELDGRPHLEPLEVRIAPATDSKLDAKLMRLLDAGKSLRLAERSLWGPEPDPPRMYRKASEHRHREVMVVFGDGGVSAVMSTFDVSERTAYRWAREAAAAGFGEGSPS